MCIRDRAPRPVLASSSGSPSVLGGGSRDAPPHPRPASFSDPQGAAFGGRARTGPARKEVDPRSTLCGDYKRGRGVSSVIRSTDPIAVWRLATENGTNPEAYGALHLAISIVENQDLTPFLVPLPAGDLSGGEGCPASGVRAPAGTRTAPRAGRRIRRSRACNENDACTTTAIGFWAGVRGAARSSGPPASARRSRSPRRPAQRGRCGSRARRAAVGHPPPSATRAAG